jgi:NADH dehydrogenase
VSGDLAPLAQTTHTSPVLRKEEPRIVILGGGFGGLAAARGLARARAKVTLLDRSNHHVFQPLLYQVATAALAAPDVAAPIRRLLRRQKNTTVLMADVVRIEPEAKRVALEDGSFVAYDALIVATGMTHAYFGHDAWAEHAPGLKTLGEALDIRNRILSAFELAERTDDEVLRRALTTFVVIGGGPTGVELAGALAEIAGRTLARDFRRFDPTTTRVVLIEGTDRILSTFDPSLSEKARASLAQLGVDVRLGARVTQVDGEGVDIGGERIHARTVLWAAGVRASGLTKDLGAPLDRSGRVEVKRDLSCPNHPEVFVVGDCVALDQDGKRLPGVSQMAMQSGRLAAANAIALMEGRPTATFAYNDKGSMATIGRARAIAEIGRARFSGFFAWLLWLFVHVFFLIDFRNRMAVLAEWFWSYITWRRSSRVILEAPAGHGAPRPSLPPR